MVIKNWELKSRSRFCFACERPFNVGQVYHCLLDFSREELERKDYCERCWKEKELEQRRKADTEAYWRAIFKRLYTPVEDEAIKKDVIQSLLDKYINSEEPSHINLCYILGLLEERKKVFLPRKHTTDQEGNKIVIYENVQTGDTCIIRDPGLTLAEAEKVQAEVQELIELEKAGESGGEKAGEDGDEAGEEPVTGEDAGEVEDEVLNPQPEADPPLAEKSETNPKS